MFSQQYSGITKKILLAGVELERYSLNYRLEHCNRSLVKKAVFFGTQETVAATGLAFEVNGDRQFNRGRHRLLSFNKKPVGRSLRGLEVGSIVAASGCGFELAANTVQYAKARKHGFDSRSASRFVRAKLAEIDKLLSERETLVDANSNHPAHERAVIEGRILKALRNAFLNEYAHFNSDTRSAFAVEQLFFLLNAAYNTVGAIGADVAYRSLDKPNLNGRANILFTISGAMAATAPLICSAELWAHRKLLMRANRKLGGSDDDVLEIAKQRSLLESATDSSGSLMPSFPSTQRFAMYSESNRLFAKQLENETTTMRRLNKIALQNSVAGPAIGGLLMTQGILGTRGFYKYFPRNPKKQFDLDYKGAVCGTVGTSMAVVGNAALCLASLSYEHRLKAKGELPEQLIKKRLEHLSELEKTINEI